MYTALTILSMLVCALLGAVIIIQNPKGGGLTPAYAKVSKNTGVSHATTVVEKLTWGLGS